MPTVPRFLLAGLFVLFGQSCSTPPAADPPTDPDAVDPPQAAPVTDTATRHPVAEPHGTASGWVEFDGVRSEVSFAYAFRVVECGRGPEARVYLTNRRVEPDEPPVPIATGIPLPMDLEDGDVYVSLRGLATGWPVLAVRRGKDGSWEGFNGMDRDSPPAITVDDGDRIEGRWTDEDPDPKKWVGEDPEGFDFRFAADVSDVLLTGEPVPDPDC